MSGNRALAGVFEELAALMEIAGHNAFKVNANRRAARVLEALDRDVSEMVRNDENLQQLDGIGAGSASKITQWCTEGRIEELEALRVEVPRGLVALLGVPGLGPKTVGRLWHELDIVDRDGLLRAIDDGSLASLPRMGAKTIANIADALAFTADGAERTLMGIAMPLAEALIERLSGVKGVGRLEYAGSLRRGCETIGDIDILATADDPAALVTAFTEAPDVVKVLAAGDTKASVRLEVGIQVDLRIVEPEQYGAALMYFTGSKEHNVVLRERAQQSGRRLNEYGLFPDDGEDTPPQQRGIAPEVAGDEQAIYAALGLPWHPPELREERDDVDAEPPTLVEVSDIRAELHAHTRASDGHLTIAELVDQARARGFHTIAITDHSISQVQANGLSPERLETHITEIREENERRNDITVLAGSEVDILPDGTLDYDDDLLAQLDIVVASPHAALRQSPPEATARLIKAIEHRLVHIIGHPTGRMIGQRPGLEPDMHALCAAAAEHGTALEINCSPRRLDLRDRHVRLALEAGCEIAIDTDAHAAEHFDNLRYGVLTGRRGGLTAQACINTWPADRLAQWLARSR